MRDQVAYLEDAWGRERLARLAREDAVGDPLLLDAALATSHNRVHHLFHLARYERATGKSVSSSGSVLEWGGGYGSLARLLLRVHGGTPTYTIVDTPLMCALQWLYLSSVLGEERVHHLVEDGDAILEGKVNLVPTTLDVRLPRPPDLFVSTWALSECPVGVVERVAASGWFGAKGLLLAYQRDQDGQFPAARLLGASARESGAVDTPVEHIPTSAYAFR